MIVASQPGLDGFAAGTDSKSEVINPDFCREHPTYNIEA
eukprot:CAMPEP_0195036768 /NCGR_PEP_ID=MMETSP0326_2-20130528/73335_1 /TAXON_ID=2866 ORGANISM="Crypthecodinium cohnii, Strain Seligo" /NCGR_SAMPLE_ID=MMETSP0326_2 /ASSEMBLY_ACC=CAM_ASM_000348 /LENGTH=38 /DNA_ID= /DNA_START= /DNA_END= /DNA_ORIENTATION=